MQQSRSRSVLAGLAAGVTVTTIAAVLMGQGANQPVKPTTEYFVTGDHDHAHLWVREGTALRVVGHGECKNCPMEAAGHDDHDHKDGDGHDHGKEAPKK